MIEFRALGRLVVVGLNTEPTLRFGVYREPTFVAIGFWPLLIGVGRRPKVVEMWRELAAHLVSAPVKETK